ncbi:MAG: hypothetical protein IKY64_03140 [Bacteroidaceae bacterium]|nr:hypothetical protein [Bacteroidaceae bacterium]
MKQALIAIALLLVASQLSAQTDFETYKRQQQQKLNEYNQQKQDFKAYTQQQREEFEAYRAKLNAEYAEYMRKAWTAYKSSKAIPVPKCPEPVKPVTVDPTETESMAIFKEILMASITPSAKPKEPVMPVVPLPEVEPVVMSLSGHSFTFYGTPCYVELTDEHRFELKSVKEYDVSKGWKLLSEERYLSIVSQCMEYREKLGLCDWGYVRFVQELTESFFTENKRNEAVLMQQYILVQSGYKVRMARTTEKLMLLLPMKEDIYSYSYVDIRGEHYYVMADLKGGDEFYVLDREFPKEQTFSLYISSSPQLANSSTVERSLTSRKLMTASVAINKNLIDFYNDYPQCAEWPYYAAASLSPSVKQMLYPSLKQQIKDLSQTEAANLLLNFVQTAFDYQTDGEQFGAERTLFADESFYYPYCDCEDRSILYANLVHDLLGLDAVLLHYPGHLATAVRFTDEVSGSYISLNGVRYLVCDPTYIGASIGMSMPKYRDSKVEVKTIW